MSSNTRPLYEHGTLSAADTTVTLRDATYAEMGAELQRRAKAYEESLISDSSATTQAVTWTYDPERPRRLRKLAGWLEDEE